MYHSLSSSGSQILNGPTNDLPECLKSNSFTHMPSGMSHAHVLPLKKVVASLDLM